MVLLTNTGKSYTVSSVVGSFSSNYTEIRIWIYDVEENEIRRVFGSQLESQVLSVYNDDMSLDIYKGFTNLIMVKQLNENCYFIVLKKPEE